MKLKITSILGKAAQRLTDIHSRFLFIIDDYDCDLFGRKRLFKYGK